jgi:hypothetical protein
MAKLKKYNIPVIIQYACFSVFEQHQFKVILCNNGHSLIKSINDEVMLLKRFSDESQNDLCGGIKLNNGTTILST